MLIPRALSLVRWSSLVHSDVRVQALHVLCKLASITSVHPSLYQQVQWEDLCLAEGLRPSDPYHDDWDLRLCLILCLMQMGPCVEDMAPFIVLTRDKVRALLQTTTIDSFLRYDNHLRNE